MQEEWLKKKDECNNNLKNRQNIMKFLSSIKQEAYTKFKVSIIKERSLQKAPQENEYD